MIECRNCHQQIEDKNSFCHICGEKLRVENKTGIFFSILSLISGALAFHLIVCIIAIVFGIIGFGFYSFKPYQKKPKLDLFLSCIGVIIAIVWLLAYIL